jgi:hypothetical protein
MSDVSCLWSLHSFNLVLVGTTQVIGTSPSTNMEQKQLQKVLGSIDVTIHITFTVGAVHLTRFTKPRDELDGAAVTHL